MSQVNLKNIWPRDTERNGWFRIQIFTKNIRQDRLS